MVNPEIVNEWLAKADEDFNFARVNLEEGKTFFAQICFHFHQAAEKYFKAYTAANELEFRKVHDLPLLLRICVRNDAALEELREDSDYLNAFYVETRYPVHWPTSFSYKEAQQALQAAKRIQDSIKKRLQSP